jgi:mono/diheme cytochrome c family protein
VRRLRLVILTVFSSALLAGCGAQGVVSPTPESVSGKVPKAPTFPITPAFKLKGNPTAGGPLFSSKGCTGCHTLAAAHSNATVGPNLDQLKPDYRAVTAQVTNGGAQMPAFKGQMSDQQIADVSAYVVKSTGGTVP